jgi:hypothetical protein
MKVLLKGLVAAIASFCASQASAQTNFATLAADGAWTWFNDPRAVYNNGALYFGYNRAADGKVVLSTLNLQTGAISNLWTSTLTETDDHDLPGLLTRQDGKMLAIYSRHQTDQFFTCRLSSSSNPVSAADWGPEQRNNTGTNASSGMTYSNPFQLGAEGGKIYNFARYLNYNPNVFVSTDGGSTWSAPQILIQTGTGSTRPYVKYCSDYNSRIDFLYTDAHPDNYTCSLYHMYYQGGSFYQTDGTFMTNFAGLPILHDAGQRGSVVYQYNAAASSDPNQWIATARAWCWETAYQTNGYPVCVFQVKVDNVTGTNWSDARIYYYYARWTGAAWQKQFIAHAGRPLYNGQPDYGGGICTDPQEPNTVYISTDAANPFDLTTTTNVLLGANFQIWKGTTTNGGLNFNWQPITGSSRVDNLRPYIPRRFGGEPCVLWFRGTYTSYTSFNCSIVGLFTTQVPTNAASVYKAPITYVDATSGPGGNTMLAGGATFSPTSDRSGVDGLWCLRTGLANNGTVFESGGDISTAGSAANGDSEDVPRLSTVLTGLVPGAPYNIYAYFWGTTDSSDDWRIRASLSNSVGDLPLYTTTSAAAAIATDFATAPLLVEANRVMHQASLGQASADSNGSIKLFVDDDPASRAGISNGWHFRSWYDGAGYALAVNPAPPLLSYAIAGNILTLSWPADHTGWRLETNTAAVSSANSWFPLSGSAATNQVSLPLSTSNNAFFRLTFP